MVWAMPTLGDVLKELRIKRGLGLNQLAHQAGVQKSTLSLVERNLQSGMSEQNLARLAHHLGTTSEAIKLRAGIPPKQPEDLKPHAEAYTPEGFPMLRIGTVLHNERTRRHLNQRQLCDNAGIALGRYQMIERGGRRVPGGGWEIADPTSEEISRLCAALDITEEFLRQEAGVELPMKPRVDDEIPLGAAAASGDPSHLTSIMSDLATAVRDLRDEVRQLRKDRGDVEPVDPAEG